MTQPVQTDRSGDLARQQAQQLHLEFERERLCTIPHVWFSLSYIARKAGENDNNKEDSVLQSS